MLWFCSLIPSSSLRKDDTALKSESSQTNNVEFNDSQKKGRMSQQLKNC